MTYVPVDPTGRFRDVEQRFREMSRYWFGDQVVPRLVEELLGARSCDPRSGRTS